ncbi:MAG: hypothetical protein ACLRFI_03755 [Alphaproteobacteria bacterium]
MKGIILKLYNLKRYVFCLIALFFISIGTAWCAEPEFTITTTALTARTTFSFSISARGSFEIDWGDGSAVQTITRTNTTSTSYSHTYSTAGTYTIGMSGQATGYSTSNTDSAISFNGNTNIAGISGSLGAIFGTLSNGSQPRFYQLFYNCSNLAGTIPENLFDGVYGEPVSYMFYRAFRSCTKLSGSIPENLFSGLSGTPKEYTFRSVFNGCSGLTGFVPANLFAGITNTNYSSGPMQYIFYGTGLVTSCPSGYVKYTTGFETDFNSKVSCISNCTDGKYYSNSQCVNCDVGYYCPGGIRKQCPNGKMTTIAGASDESQCSDPEFSITTTRFSRSTTFSFSMTAQGTFVIDWGDGSALQTITRTNTTSTSYSHTYSTAGTYTIGISGQATGYSTSNTGSAISFNGNTNIAGISGSLGAIFGTLSNGSQPRFYQLFYNCSNLTGTIPENLFDGVYGEPVSYMFYRAFRSCTKLSGSIPENLFSGLSGAPKEYTFRSVFNGCTGLTGSIPENLFSGIVGGGASYMFGYTFSGCTGLTGSIPENLFAGISGAPVSNMFYNTFNNCSGLSGFVPPNLFAGITNTNYSSGAMTGIFGSSGLATSCPTGYTQYITGFESDFNSKVSCKKIDSKIIIVWDSANGSESFTSQCVDGGDIVLPTPPEKRGYTFTGWKLITG